MQVGRGPWDDTYRHIVSKLRKLGPELQEGRGPWDDKYRHIVSELRKLGPVLKVLHIAVLVESHNSTDRTDWNIGPNYALKKKNS